MSLLLPGFAASGGGDDAPVWLGQAAIAAAPPPPPAPPSGGGGGIVLRPYQEQAIAAVREQFASVASTLLVAATGTGKTTMFGALAKSWPGRVLILAHRYELLDQAASRMRVMTGEPVELEQAGNFAACARIVVASIQTLAQERRLARWPAGAFSLVIVDEAHHACATTYRAVLDHFLGGGAKVLGVTATPDRSDGLAMQERFETVAYCYDIADAIRDQYLAPIIGERIQVDGLDLSGVRTTAGDLNQGDLDAQMSDARVIEGVARPTFERAGDRKTILFTTSVENAHKIAAVLNEMRGDCARAIDGGMPHDERAAVLRGYRRRDFQFLVNVMIATEGFDDPDTACVAIGRPTKSRSLYAQMAGRGLRLAPGKTDCLLLDFGGNSGKHSLCAPADILAGRFTDEEVALAKEMGEKKPREQLHRLMEQARDEIKARAARKVAAKVAKFDPFDVFHIKHDAAEKDQDWLYGRQAPTPWQLERLAKWGLPTDVSRREASKLLDAAFKRIDKKLASFKQLRQLQRFGVTDINVSFTAASTLLDQFFSGKRPTPEQIAATIAANPPRAGRGAAGRAVANARRAM